MFIILTTKLPLSSFVLSQNACNTFWRATKPIYQLFLLSSELPSLNKGFAVVVWISGGGGGGDVLTLHGNRKTFINFSFGFCSFSECM